MGGVKVEESLSFRYRASGSSLDLELAKAHDPLVGSLTC